MINSPIVTDFIDGKEDAIQVFHQRPLLYVLTQYLTDSIVEAVEDIDQNQLKQQKTTKCDVSRPNSYCHTRLFYMGAKNSCLCPIQ